jgi:hypothetical protein
LFKVGFFFVKEVDGSIGLSEAGIRDEVLFRGPFLMFEVSLRFVGEVRDDHILGEDSSAGG